MSKRSQTRQLRAFEFFLSQGWKPHQASAIVGNLMAESGHSLNTTAVGDKGTAYGLAQWRLDRQDRLKSFARQRGTKHSDFDTQLAFAQWELMNTEKSAGQRLARADNPQAANDAFIGFLRPQGWTSRSSRNAHNYRGRLNNTNFVLGQASEHMPEIRRRVAEDLHIGNAQSFFQQASMQHESDVHERLSRLNDVTMLHQPQSQPGDAPQTSIDPSQGVEFTPSQQPTSPGQSPFGGGTFADTFDMSPPPMALQGHNFMEGLDPVPRPPAPGPSTAGGGGGGFKLPPPPTFEVNLPPPLDRSKFREMKEMATRNVPGLPPMPDAVPTGNPETDSLLARMKLRRGA